MLTGEVASFDPAVGWGTVRATDGTDFPFHATAIAGGARQIDVATTVTFRRTPGLAGQWEATALLPLPAALG